MSEEKTNDQKKYPDNVAWDEKEGWVGHKLPYIKRRSTKDKIR